MGVYTAFKDGYAIEGAATYGTSAIIQATQTYLWGVISQKAVHPSPKTSVLYRPVGVNAQEVPAGSAWKHHFLLNGMYAVGMQNGILLWAVMGKSSTAGGGPYTHTISAPTDGTVLRSFTIQHERTGTATAWSTQFTGCKVAGLTLTCSEEQKYLISKVDWIAQKAADPAFQLTNDPTLPPTATTTPYTFSGLTRTWDYGGTPIALDGLVNMELAISPDLSPIFAHKWDTGTWTGQWLYTLLEAPRKKYTLTMDLTPEQDDLWDELVALSNTKDVYFKWTKSTNDYIAITCTDCMVIEHELVTPETSEECVDRVVCEPRSLSITVVDSIAGAQYGE